VINRFNKVIGYVQCKNRNKRIITTEKRDKMKQREIRGERQE
jgi:hypothetical protein